MGILRGVKEEIIEPLTETIISSGLKTIEITMNTPDAAKLIKKMKEKGRGKIFVGAGTVLTLSDLRLALDAGATFIVSPILVNEITQYCTKNKIPVFPGAFTPQEIYNCWNAGASMVKVFPAKYFGADYLKEIKGPFNEIKLLACGGITAQNIAEFIKNGASAAAFGTSIFKNELLENKKLSEIETKIRELIQGLRSK